MGQCLVCIKLSSCQALNKVNLQVIDDSIGEYTLTFGCDYLHWYGIDLKLSENVIEWDGAQCKMHPKGYWAVYDVNAIEYYEGPDEKDSFRQFVKLENFVVTNHGFKIGKKRSLSSCLASKIMSHYIRKNVWEEVIEKHKDVLLVSLSFG